MASTGLPSDQTIPEKIRRMVPIAAPHEQKVVLVHLHEMLARAALESLENVRAVFERRRSVSGGCVLLGPNGERLELPETVFHVLVRVAEVLANGDALTVVPVPKDLTTQQAADLLNVSRQYLVRLLNANEIPHTKTGTHRRIRTEAVLEFKRKRDAERSAKLKELTALSEEFGGYDDLD